jgi:hypothetical protein
MKRIFLSLFMLAALPLFAAEDAKPNPNSQEVVVRVVREDPKPVVPPTTTVQKASEWVQLGNDVGTAIGSGLKSVAHEVKDATFGKDVTLLDGIDKLSKTDAGRFTMAAVAWKVAGKDAIHFTEVIMARVDRYIATIIHIAIGVPLLIVWIWIACWFIRKNFMTHRVLVEKSGSRFRGTLKKNWKIVNEDELSDARKTGCTFSCIISIIVGGAIIGAVIL